MRGATAGLARQLVREALEDVRQSGLRVRPVCSYVTRLLDESSDYADIDVRRLVDRAATRSGSTRSGWASAGV